MRAYSTVSVCPTVAIEAEYPISVRIAAMFQPSIEWVAAGISPNELTVFSAPTVFVINSQEEQSRLPAAFTERPAPTAVMGHDFILDAPVEVDLDLLMPAVGLRSSDEAIVYGPIGTFPARSDHAAFDRSEIPAVERFIFTATFTLLCHLSSSPHLNPVAILDLIGTSRRTHRAAISRNRWRISSANSYLSRKRTSS